MGETERRKTPVIGACWCAEEGRSTKKSEREREREKREKRGEPKWWRRNRKQEAREGGTLP